jgi:hypothetical protein
LNGDTWDKIDDDPKLFCAVVWAGLQLYHPQLTFEEVQHMLLPGDLADLMTAVLKAWTMVSPKQVEKADPKIEPTTEPTSVQQ